jgi:hypothetical protein
MLRDAMEKLAADVAARTRTPPATAQGSLGSRNSAGPAADGHHHDPGGLVRRAAFDVARRGRDRACRRSRPVG